ncbi:GNAT family N-acetyltransferase [Amycolatopsis aidingensis]|uniref:GNAT family N-acetyltransferase n=1 Tax=Amycolatopsis aidingensis TaxID=2842453 RepID=UPI001C0C21AE|nr:GNAT family N-acetyltransferase [Amycolatopsis aidingensis]
MRVAIRPAGAADAAFLTEMLVEAAFWRPEGPRGGVGDVVRHPALAHYVAGWPRPGDLGVVAERGDPIGAAWLRYFTADDPGYGFVDTATPEVSMGVLPQWRGQGVGQRLLDSLVDAARRAGVVALSLSVEPGNHARRLYERSGFEQVGAAGGALTMLLHLC